MKLVATPNDVSDVLRLLELQAAHRDGRLSVFGMGEAGIATVALAPYLGAALSFGAFDPARATAPGQVGVRDLDEVYAVARPRRVRRLFAFLGDRVSHSLSPAIHNANFEALGLGSLYVPFALRSLGTELPALVAGLDALGLLSSRRRSRFPSSRKRRILPTPGMAPSTRSCASPAGAPARFRSANTDRDAFERVIPERPEKERQESAGRLWCSVRAARQRVAVDVLRMRGYEVFVVNRGAS